MRSGQKNYLALDLGASNGRAVLGSLKKDILTIREIKRFPNIPVRVNKTLYWNFLSLWENVIESLRLCAKMGCDNLNGIGIDTWGVDFGLIGKDGNLLCTPVHYRDNRTEGIEKEIFKRMHNKALYRLTGLSFMSISTLAQIVAFMKNGGNDTLNAARFFLMMPDLFRYFLCGSAGCDRTIAGSSQLVNINTNRWSQKIQRMFHIPSRIFPPLIDPGTIAGTLLPMVAEITGVRTAPVFVVAGHDTPSAAAAVPSIDDDAVLLSCGSWAVLGIVAEKPIIMMDAIDRGFVNETGFQSNLFVKNMMGLYLFELYYSALNDGGQKVSYSEMVAEASQAKAFQCFLNIDDPIFFATTDVEKSAIEFLMSTKQKAPKDRSTILRALLESLAFSCRHAINDLEHLLNRKFKKLFMVGGGSQNRLLCQFIANAVCMEIIAGPSEATVIGNLGIQAFASGEVHSPSDIRKLVASSFDLFHYKPENVTLWERYYTTYRSILDMRNK